MDSDNRIFIDPAVLENATDKWSVNANNCVQSFFDCLFVSLKHNQSDELFNHAHEQNAVDYGQSDRDAKYYKMAECHKLVKIHQLGQMFLAKA